VTGTATDGVRLICQRPSVLIKVGHLATDMEPGGGLVVAGPDWENLLRELLATLAPGERAGLWAVRIGDPDALPLPAEQALARVRSSWFPEFLSSGAMAPHFQVIVDLATGEAYGREALMRGKLGATEVRGEELVAAAEAHEALFSFDARARTAALEVGVAGLPAGERLFVNIDPRAVVDVPTSVRATWNVVERVEADPALLCFDLVNVERCPDRDMLVALCEGYRQRGALVCLDDLSGGGDALTCLELLQPDIAKLDTAITAGIEVSPGRRRLVAAVVEMAHEQHCKVVAEGVERVSEFEVMRDLGVDFGQGFYFGQPSDRMLPVDPRLVQRSAELV
jgi:EAL domain-containing protein (putative c-di-GMP-specific phosphodiesterase class I)